MAAKKKKSLKVAGPTTIHEAELASGPSGAVLKGPEIDIAAAIARRQAGLNVVVCGEDIKANSRLAKRIEAAVGSYQQEVAHKRAGPCSLPHFQQEHRSRQGHCFYETSHRKTRKKP